MGNNFTPAWIKKGFFNESLFCDDFLSTHQLLYSNGAFFTPEGRVTDTMNLRCEILDMLRDHIGANIAKTGQQCRRCSETGGTGGGLSACHRPYRTGKRHPVFGRYLSGGQAGDRPQPAPGQV